MNTTSFDEITLGFILNLALLECMNMLQEVIKNEDLYENLLQSSEDISLRSGDNEEIDQDFMNLRTVRVQFFIEIMIIVKSLQQHAVKGKFVQNLNRSDKLFRMLSGCIKIPNKIYYKNLEKFYKPSRSETIEVRRLENHFKVDFILDEAANKLVHMVLEVF